MRINEYNQLEQFVNEYTGIWNPSEEHWFGLEFKYKGNIYRLSTGSMFNEQDTILPDGRTAVYGIYILKDISAYPDMTSCELLGEYADMKDLLSSKVIDGIEFCEVIMDDQTEILAKD